MYLTRFPSFITRFCFIRFFNLKFPSYEKLAMRSQFDLTRFYDVIIRNSGIPDPSFISKLFYICKHRFKKEHER